jgi:sulfur carrier protein ThiS adenylyltransferase
MTFEKGLSKYIDKKNLSKIRSFKIGIAGTGGLGSNCAMMLVRSGFNDFIIADFDIVDHSNLNRQFFFFDQVGKKKTDMLSVNLLKINQNLNISKINDPLSSENIKLIFSDCDIIIEAFDDPYMKKVIIESFVNTEKFLVSASGISGFKMYEKIKVRKVRENFYLVGDEKSEISSENPPVGPGVNIAASIQADIVLSYALGKL